MRKHTKEFKSSISTFGRELDSKITVLGTELILEKEDLFSVTPITNSTLLKSVMKEVDFESKKQIGIGQEVNIKSGVKVNNEYEYIDYGNYSVYKSEYKAETDTYSHICYDKMLKTMIDYTPLDITYPINLREYINAIATKCGLEFADKNSAFANYNTSINEDHFSNGNYTFRDVLDYIAQLVGGWLCINDNDELEIRYPELAKNYDKVSGENVSFISNVEDEINTIIIDGKSTQETRSGKNLFDKNATGTLIGVKKTVLNTGLRVTLSSSSNYRFISINIGGSELLGKTLTFGGIISPSSHNSGSIALYFGSSSNTAIRFIARQSSSGSKTITIPTEFPSGANEIHILLYGKTTGEGNIGDYVDYTNLMVVMGNSLGDYEDYGVMPSPDYPSEIESVGTYNEETGKYGIEVNITGKNLYGDINWLVKTYAYFQLPTLNEDYTLSIKLKEGKTIPSGLYFMFTQKGYYDPSQKRIELISNGTLKFSSHNNTYSNEKFNYISVYPSSYKDKLTDYFDIQLEKGTVATNYEEYKSNSTLFILDQPLRSLPNGVKDIAYIKNNILYVDRKVGSVVLDGSEGWSLTIKNDRYSFWKRNSDISNMLNYKHYKLCNYFEYENESYLTASIPSLSENSNDVNHMIIFNTDGSQGTTVDEWKNWLSTHNTQVDYELAEPYTETIGEVETLSTFEGVNNVSLDANMQTNMTITYPTEYEELDKHFLKDVNVSFYKKYGAINSVVFSRGNGSDNIYRKDNMSISRNGLTEIKITGNPFLEGNDRENFIQQLFDKINGLEFYIMDVASTGIMYLELGDLYYFNMIEEKPSLKSGLIKSGMRKAQGSSGGNFLCLLMNDEIKITQGLEESIYSDEPEITETNYKTASITDTSIKNAIIQTNKNSAEILLKVNSDEVVSAINLSPENIKISSAKLDIDAIATFTNSKLAEAGSTIINGANITTGSINCDRLNGGTINGQAIRGGSISIEKGVYYFNMGTSTSNPNCSGLNVGGYGVKAYSDITATGFAITDGDTGKSQSINIYDGHGRVWYLTFTGGILTASEYK